MLALGQEGMSACRAASSHHPRMCGICTISGLTCGGQQGQCSRSQLWGQIVHCPKSTNPGAREAKREQREQHAAPSAATDASA